MARIKFTKLILSDWRASTREIDFSDHTLIMGKNGSGKSTVWDAILWLLTGYDSMDRNNFELFDNTVIPTHENSKPASVELFFNIDDYSYRLKKTARMGWTRPRGKDYYEKKPSDEYYFEIDGVEVPASQYKTFIEKNFCPIDKLKFILNIDHYLSMDWKELRKHFADIIGEVKREDYQGDFTKAWELIDRYNGLENAKEHLNAEARIHTKNIGNGGERKGEKVVELETLQSELPDISNIPAMRKRYDEIVNELKDIDNKKDGRLDVNNSIAEERTRVMKEAHAMEDMYAQHDHDYNRKHDEKVRNIKDELLAIDKHYNDIMKYYMTLKQRYDMNVNAVKECKKSIEFCETRHKTLTGKVDEIKATRFNDEHCHYCGARLSEEKIDELKQKFDKAKQEQLDDVILQGKNNRQEWNRLLDELAKAKELIKDMPEMPHDDRTSEKASLNARLEDLKAHFIPYEETKDGIEELDAIMKKKDSMPSLIEIDVSDLDEQIVRLEQEKFNVTKELAKQDAYDMQISKINLLKADIRNAGIQLAEVLGLIDQLDKIEQQKAEIVKARVSKLFKYCDVQMEERKKDGQMIPSCILTLNNVKAQVNNTASQILIGADISNAFCKHYDIEMPLIVDNRERIDKDNLIEQINSDRQLIELQRNDCEFSVYRIG